MHYEVRVWNKATKKLIFVGSRDTMEEAKFIKYEYLAIIGQS